MSDSKNDRPDQNDRIHADIELVAADDLIPYSNNPKEHPEEQVKKIASSIKNYGWDQPIVVDGENEIIKGHGRLQAAERLGLDRVPVIRREDLSGAEAKAARIADNKTAESPWDEDLLETEIEIVSEDYSAVELGFDDDELDDLLAEIEGEETEGGPDYTDKIESPVYEPTGEKPSIEDLYDAEKCRNLRERIDDADIADEKKDFLRLAAARHIVFDYEAIAEWYAHENTEVQDLVEALTLVIVDYDQAIEQGFVDFADEVLPDPDGSKSGGS